MDEYELGDVSELSTIFMKKKETRGGARKGAGRKALPGDWVTVTYRIEAATARAARKLAQRDEQSLNQFVNDALKLACAFRPSRTGKKSRSPAIVT